LKRKPLLYFILFLLSLSAGLAATWLSFQKDSLSSVADEIARRLDKELSKVEEDFEHVISTETIPDNAKLNYPIFVYKRGELIYWSDNTFVPTPQQAYDGSDLKLYTTGSEAYLLRKKKVDNDRVVVCVLPLFRKYQISNDYLTPEYNERILPSANINVGDISTGTDNQVCLKGNCLFRISIQSEEIQGHLMLRRTAFVLLTLAVIFFVVWIYSLLRLLNSRFREVGFIYLIFVLWMLRVVMTHFGFPGNLIHSRLFDPQVFASSSLNASLGDFFINLIALLAPCIYLFRNYHHFYVLKFASHRIGGPVLFVFSGLCILFSALFPYVVIQTLCNNSTIELDISQSLQFDSLRVVAITSVLISGVSSFLFAHAFIRILAMSKNKLLMWSCLAIAIAFFALINEATNQPYVSSSIIAVVYVLVVYIFSLHRSLKRLTFETFGYLFAAIFSLSVIGAYTVQYFTQKEKIENQFRFASNFLIERDIFGEYLLHETSQKIARDAFTQTRLASPFLGKEAVRQKIRQVFLPSYFNKYDVDISIYNSSGEPLDNSEASLSSIINKFDKDSYQTGYDGIYFLNNQELDVAQKYLVLVTVKRGVITSGYVIIQLSLKKILPDNVYPELLVDYRIQQFYRTQNISYALFANNKIIFSSGEFNYERFFSGEILGNTSLYTHGLAYEAFDHIAVEDQSGKIAVVSTRQMQFTHKLSNFSFYLVLGLLVILFMIFVQGIYQYFRGGRLFFSARIQLYLNLAFFIPLIIVSISTLSLTSQSSQQQLNEEYLDKSKVFSQQMVSYLDDEGESVEYSETFTNRLTDLTKLSDLDANIYNAHGLLIATSQPLIFENNLLSNYMNGQAFVRVKNGENLFIESERVGKLSYFVAFAALKSSKTGKLIGILGIPFFQSAYLLEKIQSIILINILNIFAFIFIILLLLSYVVADRLTFPLRIITESLRRTSLTKTNTPLTWSAQDEIGLMVKEYNAMLFKLSESKSELEQTQREKAWREIAQQVAHEIKNPLTPMKLTLQQLERNVQSGNITNEKTAKAITTLLGQVDTLNEIASSFSGFVKMPEPVIQPLDVLATLKHAVDLHSPTGEIDFKTSLKEAWVMGDRQLLSRTFSNIILNALQSANPGQSIRVQINFEIVNVNCRIEFKDNGKGIDPAIDDRVFAPHFSTKKSGSGLGLAIAKQGIEQMKGRIWFKTEVGKGTSFFIELPLMT
jgi:two-component system nitrogen regulation sensor histidine kinase NtrY